MLVIRGVNVFPSSLDQILRGFPEIVEYRTTIRKASEMDELSWRSKTGWTSRTRGDRDGVATRFAGGSSHGAAGKLAARRRQRQASDRRTMATQRELTLAAELATATGAEVRAAARSGAWTGPTAGLARGFVQANLVILPAADANDFAEFCRLNPRPCPLLGQTAAGNPEPLQLAPCADLRSDVPRYRVFRAGEREPDEPLDIGHLWRRRFGRIFARLFVHVRNGARGGGARRATHQPESRNVPMYRTARMCQPAGRFGG